LRRGRVVDPGSDGLVGIAAHRAAAAGVEAVRGRHLGHGAAQDLAGLEPSRQHGAPALAERQICRGLGLDLQEGHGQVAGDGGGFGPCIQPPALGRVQNVIGLVPGLGAQQGEGGEVLLDVGRDAVDRGGRVDLRQVQRDAIGAIDGRLQLSGQVRADMGAGFHISVGVFAKDGCVELQGLLAASPMRQGQFGFKAAVQPG
jgi:hypothetical protein